MRILSLVIVKIFMLSIVGNSFAAEFNIIAAIDQPKGSPGAIAFQSFKTDANGRFFYDDVEMTSTSHIITMVAAGLSVLLLTIGLPLFIRKTTRSLRDKNLLNDPKIRIKYNSLYDSYKDRYAARRFPQRTFDASAQSF